MQLITLDEKEMVGARPKLTPTEGLWIAGGAVRQWFGADEKPSDIDIFARDTKTMDDYEKAFLNDYKVLNENKNSKTLKHDDILVQLIKIKHFKTAQELLDSFDFTVCQFAWDGKIINTTAEATISTLRKHLRIHKIQKGFEVDSLNRAFKYQRKGFTPCWGTMQELSNALRVLTEEEVKNAVEMSPGGGFRIARFD